MPIYHPGFPELFKFGYGVIAWKKTAHRLAHQYTNHPSDPTILKATTTVGWLVNSVEVAREHLEAEPICTGNRLCTLHEPETVICFYAETKRNKPLNGKRGLEI